MERLEKILEEIIQSFGNTEKLSAFELGQLDGLRWAIDVVYELKKNPPAGES
jgi:hypothetical protein